MKFVIQASIKDLVFHIALIQCLFTRKDLKPAEFQENSQNIGSVSLQKKENVDADIQFMSTVQITTTGNLFFQYPKYFPLHILGPVSPFQ